MIKKGKLCKRRDIFKQAQEVAAFQDSLGKLNDNSQLERKIGSMYLKQDIEERFSNAILFHIE